MVGRRQRRRNWSAPARAHCGSRSRAGSRSGICAGLAAAMCSSLPVVSPATIPRKPRWLSHLRRMTRTHSRTAAGYWMGRFSVKHMASRVILAAALALCLGGRAHAAKDLVVGLDANLTGLDPADLNDNISQSAARLMFEGLY